LSGFVDLAGELPLQLNRFLAASAFALAALTAVPASAQNCVGFTDVLATDPICPNVEWLRNRAITLGCTTTTYCPTDPVTRGAMALFMNRLGTALTPVFQRKRDTALGNLSFVGQQNLCPTDAVAINGYPRTAIVRGLVNLFTPDGGMDIKAWVVYSTDGGTTWITPATNDGLAYATLYPGQTPPNDVSLHPMNVIDLNVGSSYRFALAATRTTGTGGTANAYCESLVQLVNRNGTTTPFDAGPSGVHGRGD
jgi:hypothetical protein